MIPDIKRRIDQIRQGEIPEGYQKKSVGIIPQNWNKSFLGAIIKELSSGVSVNSDITIDTGIYVLKTSSVSEGKVDLHESKPIIPEDLKRVRCPVLQGTILISRMNTPMLVGECGYVNEGSNIHYLPDRLWQAINRSEKICNFKWLNYLLNSDRYRTAIHALGTGTSSSMKNISKEDFLTLAIAFPPLLEQQKIAAILTTQDKIIELKEKLLAEKQQQKKYLMQQLLTGKKRLPGFSGEWSMQPLSQLSKAITKKTADEQYEVLSISAGIGFVNQCEKFGKQIAGEQYKNYIVISRGDFSYNKGNSKKYPQGCIYPLESRECAAVPNVFISFTMQKNKCFWKYYKYLFENGWLNKQLYRLINSGVRNDGLLNLSDKEFFNCFVPAPPFNEQTAIAEILSTADHEIDLLQKDIEQEKQKKKALMQLLLTGIVRVYNG